MNYGSNIKFKGEHKGYKKGAKYKWIASAHLEHPDTIFIHEHEMWKEETISYIINKCIHMFPHETIHQLLWDLGEDPHHGYDIVRGKLLHKRKCSQYLRNIYYRMS